MGFSGDRATSRKGRGWFFLALYIVTAGVSLLLFAYYKGLDWFVVSDSGIHASLIMLGVLLLYLVYPYLRHSGTSYLHTLSFPAILGLFAVFLGKLMLQWLWGDAEYQGFVEYTLPLRLAFVFLLFYGMSLLVFWQKEQERGWDMKEREAITEKLAIEAELHQLRLQLQPHFLFNSLNSVSALIGKNPAGARDMLLRLADFFRLTIQKSVASKEPFDCEWERIGLYLAIEKTRFGDRLQVHMEKEEALGDWAIPPLVVQPLVENAVKFGLYGVIDTVSIQINAYESQGMLHVAVSNPFDSDTLQPSGTGFGLESVRRRLYLLYGRQDLLHTQKRDGVFTAMLKIPQIHDKSSNNRR
ncbi:signal transduction histidine kinase, LytS [Lunatimonas lonarensis]|uniref:Signal transduction histidine kinase, LytS n=1 Tax=Lunatimonas lonarensis TaxID=1232681 RepID=R7ZP21_9BACT|nr:histidine kinase [Lunatimonas lonarensis]EON75855.1 signal transduction histidine kinase, LytS [Lunatimonas lonarensis]